MTSKQDLINILRPLILDTTLIEPAEPECVIENSQLCSHFGGMPYFEAGETWPTTKDGKPMDLIMQVINTGNINLPEHIKILQFFYNDWDDIPWESSDDGWFVKTYANIDEDKRLFINTPIEVLEHKKTLGVPLQYCGMVLKSIKTLPHFECIDDYCPVATKLLHLINEEDTWDVYDEVTNEMVGEHGLEATLGGYPQWIQNNERPSNSKGEKLPLLFQLDMEPAGLRWGMDGHVYVFYDPKEAGKYFYVLQDM